jgi:hypothetical protein
MLSGGLSDEMAPREGFTKPAAGKGIAVPSLGDDRCHDSIGDSIASTGRRESGLSEEKTSNLLGLA